MMPATAGRSLVHDAQLLFSSQIPQNYDQGKAKAIRHLKALEDGIAMKLSKERHLTHFWPTFLDASLRQVCVCVSTVTSSVFSTDFTPFVLLHSEPRLLFQSLFSYPLIQARQKSHSNKESETAQSSIFHFG